MCYVVCTCVLQLDYVNRLLCSVYLCVMSCVPVCYVLCTYVLCSVYLCVMECVPVCYVGCTCVLQLDYVDRPLCSVYLCVM